jgi:WhiB family redox-sensing transcriptional regulator
MKLAEGQEVQPGLMASRPRRVRCEPHDLTDRELAGRVYRLARCASSRVDPDAWFPMTWDVAKARDQAAHAIAVCARCPVRPDCLELSLRHAFGIGSHGVWGGLVEEERRAIRRAWLAGTSVTEFLQEQPARLRRDQQMALHRGHPRRRRGCGPSCGRLLQRVHVPVELGGVIRYLDPDVPGVYLRLALERVLDHGLDLPRAHRRLYRDEVRHAHDSSDVADHPLDLVPLVLVLDLAFQR